MIKEYKKILAAIKKYDTIVVLRHEVPDFDASGSQFGLVTWIKDNFPKKTVYALGKTHKLFSPKLYPATDENVNLEGVKYLCIVVDVADTPRIDGKEYIDDADYLIKIDHHPLCDTYGDIYYVDTHASAAAELVGDMLVSFKKKISSQCAYYLFSAIVGDSGRFQYSSTNPRTFKVVGELMKTGFNFQEIYDKMYLKSMADIKVIKFLYDEFKVTEKGVAYYMVSVNDLKELGVEREELKAHVNLLSGYNEIPIWVQFTEDDTSTDEFTWRVSIRSRGVTINGVATNHHGGGHANASGAKCVDEAEMLQMVKELDDLL